MQDAKHGHAGSPRISPDTAEKAQRGALDECVARCRGLPERDAPLEKGGTLLSSSQLLAGSYHNFALLYFVTQNYY